MLKQLDFFLTLRSGVRMEACRLNSLSILLPLKRACWAR